MVYVKMVNKGNLTRRSNIHNSRLQLSKGGSDNIPLMLIHWVVVYPLDGAIHHFKTLFEPLPLELLSRSSNVGAARKVFPHWSQKTITHHCFSLFSYCFTVRLSNQLAFRVRRAGT